MQEVKRFLGEIPTKIKKTSTTRKEHPQTPSNKFYREVVKKPSVRELLKRLAGK